MLDASGRGHRARYVDHGRNRVEMGRRAHALHIVHAVLKTDDDRAGREMRRQGFRGILCVECLYAKEYDAGVVRGSFRGSRHRNPLLEMHRVEE